MSVTGVMSVMPVFMFFFFMTIVIVGMPMMMMPIIILFMIIMIGVTAPIGPPDGDDLLPPIRRGV